MKIWRIKIIWKKKTWIGRIILQNGVWEIIFKIKEEEIEEWHVAYRWPCIGA